MVGKVKAGVLVGTIAIPVVKSLSDSIVKLLIVPEVAVIVPEISA
jgi:hypothetical protein